MLKTGESGSNSKQSNIGLDQGDSTQDEKKSDH